MKYVEIYKLQNNGEQIRILKCFLSFNIVEFDKGDKQIIKNLNSNGIKNYLNKSPTILYPKDGLLFLENMRFNFNSGYLNASTVKDE